MRALGRPSGGPVPAAASGWCRRLLRGYARRVHRTALALLFGVIAASLGAIAVFAALAGGGALVIAFAAGALALWMADLARRSWPRRRR